MVDTRSTPLNEIIFLDIETVPAFEDFTEVSEDLQKLWIEKKSKKKKKKIVEEEDTESPKDSSSYENAGLSPEFGRIICVSLGIYDGGTKDSNLKIRSLSSHKEIEILNELSVILNSYPDHKLCAHNGKGFDFPFLGKRFLINQLPLPPQLDIMGLKPWEVPHIDTNELWAFGSKGFDAGAPLKLLCAVFGIPSPKDDIDGSQVRQVYYEEDDLPRIVKYCEKDVVSLAKVFKKMRGIV